jgi:transposase
MNRDGVIKLASRLPTCVMAMEACCGAHHLGRALQSIGHQVRLMSPEYVQPYVKAQKNDERDAEAIAEAATRPTMRFVELKSETQLDMQSLHRARSRLVGERTALINQLRAVLFERGISVAQGRRRLEQYLALILGGEASPPSHPPLPLSSRMRLLIDDMRAQWRELDRRIAAFDAEFVAVVRSDKTARRLVTIPGIGVLNATVHGDDYGGRSYCLTGECYPASDPCLIEPAPVASCSRRGFLKPYFITESLFVVVEPVELWATPQRRPSVESNPQGNSQSPTSQPGIRACCPG